MDNFPGVGLLKSRLSKEGVFLPLTESGNMLFPNVFPLLPNVRLVSTYVVPPCWYAMPNVQSVSQSQLSRYAGAWFTRKKNMLKNLLKICWDLSNWENEEIGVVATYRKIKIPFQQVFQQVFFSLWITPLVVQTKQKFGSSFPCCKNLICHQKLSPK